MLKNFAEIVFPLPFEKSFYYKIPPELYDSTIIGVRAVAPFGKRILTGYVINVFDKIQETEKNYKYIEDILDSKPIFSKKLLEFCKWISEYYFATYGEVLKTAVPYGSDIESRRIIVVDPEKIITEQNRQVNFVTNYYKLLSLLSSKSEYSINELTKKFIGTNLNYNLQKLENKGLCSIFIERQKPKVSIKTENLISLTEEAIKNFDTLISKLEKKAPKQVNALITLMGEESHELSQPELINKALITYQVIQQLYKKKLIEVKELEVKREYKESFAEEKKDIVLNKDQQYVFDIISKTIIDNQFKVYLLHGVTASGKTQVYLELIKKVIEQGRTALYLVPEISLTPQVIRRVKNFFGDNVGILHSRMSLGEKYDQWRSIINKEYNIVVGPRSALFAPLENIGIIIVDEEHDSSYKQDETAPYYNARDGAIIRAMKENATVVLGSATPSLESYNNCEKGKYHLLELRNRIDGAIFPTISYINLKEEKDKSELYGAFSKVLIDKIKEKIEKKEKVILLQNRRGYSTYIVCPNCGYAELCKNCSVTLTYHLTKKENVCHYCGYSKKEVDSCPACGSVEIKYRGIGTQRLEDEIETLIPEVKASRMDFDTTSKKGAYSEILNSFSTGEKNLLLGTQMVAKGIDFPDVTLVGVISAEASLHFPDFRAAERTYQLLSQVSGRAGRSKLKGEVVIQTYQPNHYVLEYVETQNYKGFYDTEMEIRENANYPPFTKIALVQFKGANSGKVKMAAKEFMRYLRFDPMVIQVLGPAPAMIYKLNKKYRYNIILKSKRKLDPNGNILHNTIKESQYQFLQKNRTNQIKLIIDIDPISFI